VLLTIDGNKIRQGDGIYSSNKVLYTIDGNKIRRGDGTSHPTKSYTQLTASGKVMALFIE
jgi:hypothetical protein